MNDKTAIEVRLCGYDILIDQEDLHIITENRWHTNKTKAQKGLIYFETAFKIGHAKWRKDSLPRVIMNCVGGRNICVDHISGNTLDNRKKNLRVCTRTENTRNSKISIRNTTGYKGVTYHKREKKWLARITVNRLRMHLGYFKTPEGAAYAYNEAAIRYFGEFARINKNINLPLPGGS